MWRAFIWLLFNCRNSQAQHRSSRTSSPESKPNELQQAILFFFFRVYLWQWSSFSSCPSRTWNISRKTTPQRSQMLTDMQHLHLIPCYLLFERPERCSFPQMMMSRLKDSVELCSTKRYSQILTPLVMWLFIFSLNKKGKINQFIFFCLRGVIRIQTCVPVASRCFVNRPVKVDKCLIQFGHSQASAPFIFVK